MCSVEKTAIFHIVSQILKKNVFQKKNSLSAEYIVCGTEMPFEGHWQYMVVELESNLHQARQL